MSKPVTRRKDAAAKRRRRLHALRRRSMRARRWIDRCESDARRAWGAAVKVRKEIQDHIVRAFRDQVEGAGCGPTDADLQTFARRAVAEQRLGRSLAQAKSHRYCREPQAFTNSATVRRGEHQ
jgi:hypothetical protein